MERAGRGRSFVILAAGAASIVGILWIARIAARPDYVPLMPGLSLDEVSQVTTKLDEQGIKYQLEMAARRILVAESDLAKARVALARDGLPAKGRPGFELFDKPAWGMTDFTQRINYRRALEGELERTIGEMRGVQSARCTLRSTSRRGSARRVSRKLRRWC